MLYNLSSEYIYEVYCAEVLAAGVYALVAFLFIQRTFIFHDESLVLCFFSHGGVCEFLVK